MPPRVAPPPPPEPSSDPSSPYYVHSSDGPASVKVVPVLNGSNYHAWSRSMRRALGGKLKLEFIDGTIPVPLDDFDPSYRAWNRCNMLVQSWIMNSVSDSIAQSIVFMENALDVWLDLKERFAQADLVRVAELQQEMSMLKQDSRSVTEFYSELKLLREELEIYLPMPNCSCRHRCTCEAMRTARANHHILHVIRFLTGLNDNFSVVKSQILLMDPLPPMNKVFSLVLQHERQGNYNVTDESKALMLHDPKLHFTRNLLLVFVHFVAGTIILWKIASKSTAYLHICANLLPILLHLREDLMNQVQVHLRTTIMPPMLQ
jgi:hypothetical protein